MLDVGLHEGVFGGIFKDGLMGLTIGQSDKQWLTMVILATEYIKRCKKPNPRRWLSFLLTNLRQRLLV